MPCPSCRLRRHNHTLHTHPSRHPCGSHRLVHAATDKCLSNQNGAVVLAACNDASTRVTWVKGSETLRFGGAGGAMLQQPARPTDQPTWVPAGQATLDRARFELEETHADAIKNYGGACSPEHLKVRACRWRVPVAASLVHAAGWQRGPGRLHGGTVFAGSGGPAPAALARRLLPRCVSSWRCRPLVGPRMPAPSTKSWAPAARGPHLHPCSRCRRRSPGNFEGEHGRAMHQRRLRCPCWRPAAERMGTCAAPAPCACTRNTAALHHAALCCPRCAAICCSNEIRNLRAVKVIYQQATSGLLGLSLDFGTTTPNLVCAWGWEQQRQGQLQAAVPRGRGGSECECRRSGSSITGSLCDAMPRRRSLRPALPPT